MMKPVKQRTMHEGELTITLSLVRHLVDEQFPQFRDLPLKETNRGGTMNHIYMLGDNLYVRVPRMAENRDVEKEALCLNFLKPFTPVPIPVPLAVGKPTEEYPSVFGIFEWLDGSSLQSLSKDEESALAKELSSFVQTLYSLTPDPQLPPAGRRPLKELDQVTEETLDQCLPFFSDPAFTESFLTGPSWKGTSSPSAGKDLSVSSPDETLIPSPGETFSISASERAISFPSPEEALSVPSPEKAISVPSPAEALASLKAIWKQSMDLEPWDGEKHVIHADLLPTNILMKDGKLRAVIDFGSFGVGDPCFDLLPAWAVFSPSGRKEFMSLMNRPAAEWDRARAYALHQAVLIIPYYAETYPEFTEMALRTLSRILQDESISD